MIERKGSHHVALKLYSAKTKKDQIAITGWVPHLNIPGFDSVAAAVVAAAVVFVVIRTKHFEIVMLDQLASASAVV